MDLHVDRSLQKLLRSAPGEADEAVLVDIIEAINRGQSSQE